MGAISRINETQERTHAVWLPGDDEWGVIQLVEYADHWLSQLTNTDGRD
jgi:hypothetical protein